MNEQRQIKFRAWDTRNKRMMNTPYGDEFMCEGTPINSAIESCVEDGQILMQFTGLKDTKGIEIYEEDIVQGRGNYGLIGFNRGRFVGQYLDSHGGVEEEWEDELYLCVDSLEVVGNRFEGVVGLVEENPQ